MDEEQRKIQALERRLLKLEIQLYRVIKVIIRILGKVKLNDTDKDTTSH